MSRRLVLRRIAERDITEAASWYERQLPGLGGDFRREFWKAAHRALENPAHFPMVRKFPETRRVLMDRFPYKVFFFVTEIGVTVFAILHGARSDNEWSSRT